jgi:hypothetical protein
MLFFGALILCLLSIAAGFAWGRVKNVGLSLVCAVIFPVIAARLIYWIPVMGVNDTSEFGAWFGVFLPLWLVPAIPASVGTTLIVRRHLSKRNTSDAA